MEIRLKLSLMPLPHIWGSTEPVLLFLDPPVFSALATGTSLTLFSALTKIMEEERIILGKRAGGDLIRMFICH
jgi:hypothetical protein